MKLVYAITAENNPLYQGAYQLRGRYQTYGQHSFVYDFVSTCIRHAIEVSVVVEGQESFSLAAPLARLTAVSELSDESACLQADVVVFDQPSERLLRDVAPRAPALCIIHHRKSEYSESTKARCDRFVCMTEATYEYQRRLMPERQLLLAHQGVDLERFRPRDRRSPPATCPRVLVLSRLDRCANVLRSVIDRLLECECELTIVGDGLGFWELSDSAGHRMVLINYIPCHSMQHFIRQYELVVSAGRGVMEALASGVPALCAGFGYGGPVLEDNFEDQLRVNLTGFGMARPIERIGEDIQSVLPMDPAAWRALAEAHCSMDDMLATIGLISRPTSRHSRVAVAPARVV